MQTVLFLAAGNNKKYPVYPGYCLCLTFLRENILFFFSAILFRIYFLPF